MTNGTPTIKELRRFIFDLRQHFFELRKKHKVIVYEWCCSRASCHALGDRDAICIAGITSRIRYAAALHEIGRLRGRYQRSNSTLVRERWAWEWARANALIWTPAMADRARKALQWHALHASWIDRPDRLKNLAHHEAGHAVVGRVLGLRGGAATIVANHIRQSYGDAESCHRETVEYWRRPVSEGGTGKLLRSPLCACRARVLMSMAGREAELECLGTIRGNYGGDRVDRDDIDELMPTLYPGASPAEWSRRQVRLRRMTRALVRRHRDKIERIASALLQYRTLSGRAIDALLPEIPAPAAALLELQFRPPRLSETNRASRGRRRSIRTLRPSVQPKSASA